VRIPLLSLIVVCGFALPANAQNFSSGSDQSDGAFDLTGTPPGTVVNFVPTNFPGDQHALDIFNFTSITIPAGVTVKLSGQTINAPVYWLASGDVDIEGTIDLSGQDGLPPAANLDARRRTQASPGGYNGGVGGKTDGSSSASLPVAQAGDGPGGGGAGAYFYVNGCGNPSATPAFGGTFSGNLFLVPLVGGSGGGGGLLVGTIGSTPYGASGGAGGGALLVASSTTITVNGVIAANGGKGGYSGGATGGCDGVTVAPGYGGGGSGGGIRLAANTVAGSGTLTAAGGALTCCANTAGGNGVVRIEAFTDSFTGTVGGTQSTASPVATFVPTSPPPSVTVVSVNSASVEEPPTGSLATPDVTIDTSSSVTLAVQATGIPDGTVITLHVFSDNNTDQTVQTTALSGGQGSASLTFPSGYSLNYVKATWTTTSGSGQSAARKTVKKKRRSWTLGFGPENEGCSAFSEQFPCWFRRGKGGGRRSLAHGECGG